MNFPDCELVGRPSRSTHPMWEALIRTANEDDGSAVVRAKLVAGLSPDMVLGQHGLWIDGPSGSPSDASHPLAANLNQVMSTAVADPISGSIPLRSWWCEVEKI